MKDIDKRDSRASDNQDIDLREAPSPDNLRGSDIDLRPLDVAFIANTVKDPTVHQYQRLRTERVQAFEWRDIPKGHHDADEYDDPDAETFSVLLTRGTSRELLAGLRITRPASEDLMDSLSFGMWGEQRSEIHVPLRMKQLVQQGRMLDITRLFPSPVGTAEHLVMTIGACLGRTCGEFGGFYTVERRVFLFLQRLSRVRTTVVHSGVLGGVDTVLGYIPPPGDIFATGELGGSATLSGAMLHGARPTSPLFEAPSERTVSYSA